MMIIYIFALFMAFSSQAKSLRRNYSPVVDANKFTVCAITINSDEETKVFQSQMNKHPNKFNPIVELTSLGDSSDWFSKACASGIRCDQLLISGHFGGSFFGDTGYRLSLNELEEAGCSKTCEGILNQPYEVFLFGCNTLSGKEGDHRTPAQYLQVLLDDGIPRTQAELVVESRYGAVGDSHKSSMQRAFGGLSKQLYGFHSVGPSGKNVKPLLDNYFKQTSILDNLEIRQAKRAMGLVELTNQSLATSLKVTAFTQCPAGDNSDDVTRLICALQDQGRSKDEKLALTIEALSHENFLVYLPAINNFIKNNSVYYMTDEQSKLIEEISKNEIIKNQILGLIDKTKSLSLKIEWMQFAANFKLLDQDSFDKEVKSQIKKIMMAGPTREDQDVINSIDVNLRRNILLEDSEVLSLPGNFVNFQILAITNISKISNVAMADFIKKTIRGTLTSYELANIMVYLNSRSMDLNLTVNDLQKFRTLLALEDDEWFKLNALIFFSKFEPENLEVVKYLKKNIQSTDTNIRERVITVLNNLSNKDLQTAEQILPYLKDESDWVRSLTMDYLDKVIESSPAVQLALADYMKVTNYPYAIERYFIKNDMISPSVFETMLKSAGTDAEKIRTAFSSAKTLITSDVKIHQDFSERSVRSNKNFYDAIVFFKLNKPTDKNVLLKLIKSYSENRISDLKDIIKSTNSTDPEVIEAMKEASID